MTDTDSRRQQLERAWHESEDFARDDNSLIVGVYASGVFDEATVYHMRALGEVAGLHVLDYGCGTGGTTARLLAGGAQVTGFDISVPRLLEARQHVARAPGGSQAGLLQAAAERLPFADASFDAVLGKQILHHLDLDMAVAEVARVLRPGGRAVFLEPLIHNPLLEGYRRMTPHLRSPTERALSMSDLQRIAAGFSCWQHREFILFSMLPVFAAVATSRRPLWERSRLTLQRFDRWLLARAPFVGRYCWETVIVLVK